MSLTRLRTSEQRILNEAHAREPGTGPASFERARFLDGGKIEKQFSLILQDSYDVTFTKF
jgi:hypothetical protein